MLGSIIITIVGHKIGFGDLGFSRFGYSITSDIQSVTLYVGFTASKRN